MWLDYTLGEGWTDAVARSHVIGGIANMVVALAVCVTAVFVASFIWRNDDWRDYTGELMDGAGFALLVTGVIFIASFCVFVTNVASFVPWLAEPRGTALREAMRLIGS